MRWASLISDCFIWLLFSEYNLYIEGVLFLFSVLLLLRFLNLPLPPHLFASPYLPFPSCLPFTFSVTYLVFFPSSSPSFLSPCSTRPPYALLLILPPLNSRSSYSRSFFRFHFPLSSPILCPFLYTLLVLLLLHFPIYLFLILLLLRLNLFPFTSFPSFPLFVSPRFSP